MNQAQIKFLKNKLMAIARKHECGLKLPKKPDKVRAAQKIVEDWDRQTLDTLNEQQKRIREEERNCMEAILFQEYGPASTALDKFAKMKF